MTKYKYIYNTIHFVFSCCMPTKRFSNLYCYMYIHICTYINYTFNCFETINLKNRIELPLIGSQFDTHNRKIIRVSYDFRYRPCSHCLSQSRWVRKLTIQCKLNTL